MKTEAITDHELAKIANEWVKNTSIVNIGIRTAFAAGYRLAEKQANDVQSKDGKLPIPHVIKSVCNCKNSSWNRDAGCFVCDNCGERI